MRAYRDGKSAGVSWFFFDLLVASMAMVVVARNAVLFLVAWEVMALASFFLVTFQDEEESVRSAGWTYLVATHLGSACLLALFILLGRGTGSLDFDRFTAASGVGLLFILAVVGFGSKAGFMPFHVWLPEAHPAAPAQADAVDGPHVSHGSDGDLGSSAPQRLRERVLALSGSLRSRGVARQRRRRPGVGRHRRAGSDRGAGARLLHQGVRRRLPRRA